MIVPGLTEATEEIKGLPDLLKAMDERAKEDEKTRDKGLPGVGFAYPVEQLRMAMREFRANLNVFAGMNEKFLVDWLIPNAPCKLVDYEVTRTMQRMPLASDMKE